MKYIFVQIACYKDKEVVPTIQDCIAKADNPKRLRFGICWQKDPNDTCLAEYQNKDSFKILNFHYRESRGVCWARHMIQKLYDGEEYILQIDSHHRFVKNWDRVLLRMIKETGSNKPILSSYGPSYFTDNLHQLDLTPTKIGFHRFSPAGILLQKPSYINDFKKVRHPIPARFLSGHLLFTSGKFIEEVPYDPGLYFHGEEISMAVRAYTHGYDLFHPNKLVLWHLYAKGQPTHHAYDHDPYKHTEGPWWSDLEINSVRRIRTMLGTPPGIDEFENTKKPANLGKYGLGKNRTLRDYEKYAGISFKFQSVHNYTLQNRPPPNPFIIGGEYDWEKSFDQTYKVVVEFAKNENSDLQGEHTFWYVGAHDSTGMELYRNDLQEQYTQQLLKNDVIRLSFNVSSSRIPQSCTIWPYSPKRGWLTKTVKQINIS
jgi:hypothetical protein